MEEKISNIKQKTAAVKSDLREKTSGYIVTALGLVAGLAWNDAISSLIKYLFPLDQNSIPAKFIYAGIITFVIVVISRSLLRIIAPKEE
jgi:hypothetical protein